MKGRESGMPDEAYWESFFNSSCVVEQLDCAESQRGLVEFGCGYGLFTIPAARLAKGPVLTYDIDPAMIAATEAKAKAAGLANVTVEQRDFIGDGTGLADDSVDYVMLFNILHVEDPVSLLNEARRILAPGGKVGIIHWRSDIETPRGPSLAIRPRPEQCRAWSEQAGLRFVRYEPLTCCSYHFGLIVEKPSP
ncbi:class I SAM-dependent methyltransferase [Singulisphaera acidiphila]|uniref:Methyltransferase family protein n=1 Tax=Singulisphaera acidiphila (strain ATCC BAA-1392 / DSM 18658 / VKM B-2454 / MOB10) TaxID=886293 RepID=L0DHX1_SINAD|nr:class I SAM-dependent methyltransferase [Singulisphaera acidiphila]AGA28445.1 methyltransferase family protein [Singulisphaera acidiphila DSM 18658]